jgi:hypothetical protein
VITRIIRRMVNTAVTGSICAHIAPGMSATAGPTATPKGRYIRTGTRSIMEFLLSPIARRASEAGREM